VPKSWRRSVCIDTQCDYSTTYFDAFCKKVCLTVPETGEFLPWNNCIKCWLSLTPSNSNKPYLYVVELPACRHNQWRSQQERDTGLMPPSTLPLKLPPRTVILKHSQLRETVQISIQLHSLQKLSRARELQATSSLEPYHCTLLLGAWTLFGGEIFRCRTSNFYRAIVDDIDIQLRHVAITLIFVVSSRTSCFTDLSSYTASWWCIWCCRRNMFENY